MSALRLCPYGVPEVGSPCGEPGCVHTCPRCLRPGHALDGCTSPTAVDRVRAAYRAGAYSDGHKRRPADDA